MAASHVTGPLFAGWQRRALRLGKEDPTRVDERWGKAHIARPQGPLVWFHAASVGETQSILPLVTSILDARPDLHVLMTSTTRTSAQLLAADLPDRVLHQMAPYDTVNASRAFLAHWQPDVAIWVESELWPRMLSEVGSRGIRRLLLNARVSERTAGRWVRFGKAAKALLSQFDLIHVQEETTMAALEAVGVTGAHVVLTGSLKQDRPPLSFDRSELDKLRTATKGRRVWCAASTHPGEDEVVIDAHRAVGGLLILVPRHIERAQSIAEIAEAAGLAVARRSLGEPLTAKTEIYLADTMGELGLWYRLADVAFIGGSLQPVGGHNPYEAAQLDAAILHGPHVGNFAQVYAALSQAGAAREVTDQKTLCTQLRELDAETMVAMTQAAHAVLSDHSGATDAARTAVLELL